MGFNTLIESLIKKARADQSVFCQTDYAIEGEIFCKACNKKKLAKIKLPNSLFGAALDKEKTGYLTVVCSCDCNKSGRELERMRRAKSDYEKYKNHRDEESKRSPITADDDLPF